MRISLSAILVTAIMSLAPTTGAYADCTEQDLSQIAFCLNTDSLPTCLAQHPGCTSDDLDIQTAANELGNRLFGLCCAKGSKQRILACLTVGKNSLRTTPVKNLVPAAVLTELAGNLADVVNTVKANGQCAPG